jgi:hypothetical protein
LTRSSWRKRSLDRSNPRSTYPRASADRGSRTPAGWPNCGYRRARTSASLAPFSRDHRRSLWSGAAGSGIARSIATSTRYQSRLIKEKKGETGSLRSPEDRHRLGSSEAPWIASVQFGINFFAIFFCVTDKCIPKIFRYGFIQTCSFD